MSGAGRRGGEGSEGGRVADGEREDWFGTELYSLGNVETLDSLTFLYLRCLIFREYSIDFLGYCKD